jgi:hypothetical protein
MSGGYEKTSWGGRIGCGTGSVETVIQDYPIGKIFTENEIDSEIKRRKLVNRGAIYRHLDTLSKKGYLKRVQGGWKRIS